MREFAREVLNGDHPSTVARWERNERRPGASALETIARLGGVSRNLLEFGGEGGPWDRAAPHPEVRQPSVERSSPTQSAGSVWAWRGWTSTLLIFRERYRLACARAGATNAVIEGVSRWLEGPVSIREFPSAVPCDPLRAAISDEEMVLVFEVMRRNAESILEDDYQLRFGDRYRKGQQGLNAFLGEDRVSLYGPAIDVSRLRAAISDVTGRIVDAQVDELVNGAAAATDAEASRGSSGTDLPGFLARMLDAVTEAEVEDRAAAERAERDRRASEGASGGTERPSVAGAGRRRVSESR